MLNIGDKAPRFEGKNQDGKSISLDDYTGKKLVLFFYPKDNTPGCTLEAQNLRDNYETLQSKGYEVLGVSGDDETSHQKFICKHLLPFDLLADTDKSVNEMYGVWQEKKNFGKTYMGTVRTTFIIDEKGQIEHIINKVKTKEHADQIFALEN
ncbi:thioredoxin-dependent thiol peroxidase [Aureibacter tunicatorum]|uniref:thioredoxin-dependent peroxiredoxin n=1 Tax=Aureibacter tunicatorum TaxID=866807 RepID=A0AAE3XNV5_9BACT|nr:peroxiredoxin Q/BCP [Aureibacter tunicatorum]BDD04377.1 peroxiredoxin [Aureibacter tunicatorum]